MQSPKKKPRNDKDEPYRYRAGKGNKGRGNKGKGKGGKQWQFDGIGVTIGLKAGGGCGPRTGGCVR